MPAIDRDHLFISYATEDSTFARWLALRLTALGYRVWIDQFELLGGERFPAEIDQAIKDRTHRLLAVLSRSSIAKPNPTKERTLALNLGRERGEDFLIPLNLDGMRPTELDWMTSDLTFIPFSDSWARGLSQLLELLTKAGTPSHDTAIGSTAARAAIHKVTALRNEPEDLRANLLRILEVPDVIYKVRLPKPIPAEAREAIAAAWPHSGVPGDPESAYTFSIPETPLVGGIAPVQVAASVWAYSDQFDGAPIWQVLRPTISASFRSHCLRLGLRESGPRAFYFPTDLLPGDRLGYVATSGRRTTLKVAGERSFRGRDRFRYHLAFQPDVIRMPGDEWYFKLGVRLHLCDAEGKRLDSASALARRKSMTRTWYNRAFLSRILAISHFLSEGSDDFGCGLPGLRVAGAPLTVTSSMSIDEDGLESGKNPFGGSEDDGE